MIVPIFLRFYRRLRIKAAGEAVQKEVEEKDYHRLSNRAEKAVIEHDEMMAAGNKILQMRGKPGNMEEDSKQQHKSEKQHWVPDFLPQPAEKHGTKNRCHNQDKIKINRGTGKQGAKKETQIAEKEGDHSWKPKNQQRQGSQGPESSACMQEQAQDKSMDKGSRQDMRPGNSGNLLNAEEIVFKDVLGKMIPKIDQSGEKQQQEDSRPQRA